MSKKQVAEDRWESLKAAISRKWNELTEDDLTEVKDNLDQLAAKLRDRYGLSLDEAKRQANDFLYEAGEASASAYRRARNAATNAAETLDQVAHQYTWSTVATGIVIGGLIGYICGRNERSARW